MKVAGAPISWRVSELEREASALAASGAEVLVPEDMETFLEMTQVGLCLDTGHEYFRHIASAKLSTSASKEE
ncbi:MAG: hypothetical protein E6I05_13760 [Chloroflexi bacterium]|nr:MAG: hypothetical protein E6I05_13760 [Chloroflexota bacterium]